MIKFITSLKSFYILIIQFSTWIISFISPFVISPPIGTSQETWVNFSRFFIAALVGFTFIPLRKYNKSEHTKLWLIISIFLMISGTTLFFYWDNLLESKTLNCKILTPEVIVKGNVMKENIIKNINAYNNKHPEHPLISDCEIIFKTPQFRLANPVEEISQIYWPAEEINYNRILIISTYILLYTIFTLLLIFLMQCIQCFENKNK